MSLITRHLHVPLITCHTRQTVPRRHSVDIGIRSLLATAVGHFHTSLRRRLLPPRPRSDAVISTVLFSNIQVSQVPDWALEVFAVALRPALGEARHKS